jgi:hypothetical protein
MKIELKNIKYAAFASEETSCYEATLWVDGKKIGNVSNDGRGGCDNFHGDRKAFEAAEEWCILNLPDKVYTKEKDGFDGIHTQNLESLCGQLLEDHLSAKDLAKALISKAVFYTPGSRGLFTKAYKGKVKPDDRLFESVRTAHPGAVILNTLPRDEALKIYKENVG